MGHILYTVGKKKKDFLRALFLSRGNKAGSLAPPITYLCTSLDAGQLIKTVLNTQM